MGTPLKLIDKFGRAHSSLRLSVTDRCNIRCFYCMPNDQIRFLPRREVLSFEEIVALVRLLATMGVNRLRLTGGEPLVRDSLPTLVEMLKSIAGIEEVALTTNGVLLANQAQALKDAGLDRINVSLDSIDREIFQQITRRDELPRVLEGIQAGQEAGLPIRLNALAIKGVTESQIVPLAEFALQRGLTLRFIEFMPLDFDRNWSEEQVLTAPQILTRIADAFGPLVEASRPDPAQPSRDYLYAEGQGRLGVIHSVSQPFCSQCNRLRLTAEGKLRNCLFSQREWDLKEPLRSGAGESVLVERIRQCVQAKLAGHAIGEAQFEYPDKSMHQIGG